VKGFGESLVFCQKLRVLFEDGLNFVLEFIDFFALCLEDGVFFLQKSKIGPKEFLDSVGMFVKFGDDGLASGTSFLGLWFVLTFNSVKSGDVASLSHKYLNWDKSKF
jgi:hypothetical protein